MNCRESDVIKRQSRRRTLLCCSTCCLFSFVIFLFLLTEIFHKRLIFFRLNSNKTILLNLNQYRLSLIHCGESVIKNQEFYQIIRQIKSSIENNLSFDQQYDEHLLRWLELILKECFQARQFSIIEQSQPTFLRNFISFIRKEFLYIVTFFLKDI